MSTKSLPSVFHMPDVKGKRVIVRASFDVPVHDGIVEDCFRLRRGIKTITHLKEQGAKVVILTHMGRDPKNSTEPLVSALKKYVDVKFVPHVCGKEAENAIQDAPEGTVLLLENLRREKGEEENDASFARALMALGDYYVNDAFAVSHRAHASIVGIPGHLPHFAGTTFLEECEELTKSLTPRSPSLFILGGAKFETKEPLVEEYADNYSHVFIGGAIANDFLKAKGFPVGDSLLSDVDLTGNPILTKENIILPVDVVVLGPNGKREVLVEHVEGDEKILDVGPRTMELLAPYVERAETILWNGPLGNYEAGFDDATKVCAELVAKSDAYSIVGGGDTVTAIDSLGLNDSFSFVSTAGGAMLDFLEHKTLPGIQSLLAK